MTVKYRPGQHAEEKVVRVDRLTVHADVMGGSEQNSAYDGRGQCCHDRLDPDLRRSRQSPPKSATRNMISS